MRQATSRTSPPRCRNVRSSGARPCTPPAVPHGAPALAGGASDHRAPHSHWQCRPPWKPGGNRPPRRRREGSKSAHRRPCPVGRGPTSQGPCPLRPVGTRRRWRHSVTCTVRRACRRGAAGADARSRSRRYSSASAHAVPAWGGVARVGSLPAWRHVTRMREPDAAHRCRSRRRPAVAGRSGRWVAPRGIAAPPWTSARTPIKGGSGQRGTRHRRRRMRT